MFANERQRALAICKLLSAVRRSDLWTPEGPTPEACDLLERGGGYLSSGEAIMLRVAFDFWNGDGKATVGDVIYRLDSVCLRAICGLMLALNAGSVDRYIRGDVASNVLW